MLFFTIRVVRRLIRSTRVPHHVSLVFIIFFFTLNIAINVRQLTDELSIVRMNTLSLQRAGLDRRKLTGPRFCGTVLDGNVYVGFHHFFLMFRPWHLLPTNCRLILG